MNKDKIVVHHMQRNHVGMSKLFISSLSAKSVGLAHSTKPVGSLATNALTARCPIHAISANHRSVSAAGQCSQVHNSPNFDAATLAGTLFGAFPRFLESVGLALDGDDLGVVDQAIDQRHDAGGVGKHLAPFRKRALDCRRPPIQ